VSLKWLERKIIEWGCMQALIDFDGWQRWKSSDGKDGQDFSETKRGFQVGPQVAARSLAGRLKIDRKGSRSSPRIQEISSESPVITVQTSTPPGDTPDIDPVEAGSSASASLESARNELKENKLSAAQPASFESPPGGEATSFARKMSSIHEDSEGSVIDKFHSLPPLDTNVDLPPGGDVDDGPEPKSDSSDQSSVTIGARGTFPPA